MIIWHHSFIINELKNFLEGSFTKLRDIFLWGNVEAVIPIKNMYSLTIS
jgi:hypothetical protein